VSSISKWRQSPRDDHCLYPGDNSKWENIQTESPTWVEQHAGYEFEFERFQARLCGGRTWPNGLRDIYVA